MLTDAPAVDEAAVRAAQVDQHPAFRRFEEQVLEAADVAAIEADVAALVAAEHHARPIQRHLGDDRSAARDDQARGLRAAAGSGRSSARLPATAPRRAASTPRRRSARFKCRAGFLQQRARDLRLPVAARRASGDRVERRAADGVDVADDALRERLNVEDDVVGHELFGPIATGAAQAGPDVGRAFRRA